MTIPGATGVSITTFGCRLNHVESDVILALAQAAGHDKLAVINTCAVTAEAVRQARQAIRRLHREDPARPIAVTGCAAAIEPAAFASMPEVARVVANGDKTMAASWPRLDGGPARPPAAVPAEPHHTRGFVEIQNGCDHRCTFCVIPFGRGASRSVASETVLAQARALVEAGTREIVLTGVDITAYGRDLPGQPSLGHLVRALLRRLPHLPRLRLSSIDCVETDAVLMEVIATEPRFMPHLHLSLQSGSDLVLKRMKRRHGRADAIAFCQAVRARRSDMVFGADIITGFPTETEAMFEDSVTLVAACGLTHLHVFPYSPRPGTPATRMPQVPRDIGKSRAARLRGVGAQARLDHLDARVGRRMQLLMERGGNGRSEDFTLVRVGAPLPPGALVDVVVTGHDGHDLLGLPV